VSLVKSVLKREAGALYRWCDTACIEHLVKMMAKLGVMRETLRPGVANQLSVWPGRSDVGSTRQNTPFVWPSALAKFTRDDPLRDPEIYNPPDLLLVDVALTGRFAVVGAHRVPGISILVDHFPEMPSG
jgi:hypothetical protein